MPSLSTATLGRTGLLVSRLGLGTLNLPAGDYRAAFEAGINYVLTYHGENGQPERTVAEALQGLRERIVLADGTADRTRDGLLRHLERSLSALATDRIDVYHLFYIRDDADWQAVTGPGGAMEGVRQAQAEGMIRFTAVSVHNRPLAGRIAATGEIDVMMVRYNCAHPGAESDIFPHARARECGVVTYNALKWRQLLQRPAGWPEDAPVPTPADCYRFALSHPAVHLVLTGARARAELDANIAALSPFAPLSPEEAAWLREFGRQVHG
ncbi:MAG: aldo/keto reductase [Armatimonadetes bacterium]|nr:aldo/keto reductase [Armatimonadota bacterium]